MLLSNGEALRPVGGQVAPVEATNQTLWSVSRRRQTSGLVELRKPARPLVSQESAGRLGSAEGSQGRPDELPVACSVRGVSQQMMITVVVLVMQQQVVVFICTNYHMSRPVGGTRETATTTTTARTNSFGHSTGGGSRTNWAMAVPL